MSFDFDNKNKQRYAMHAAQVFKDYLSKNANLNESLSDVAWENDLNLNEIKRIAETVNQLVQSTMLKQARDNKASTSFVFDLADPEKVASFIKEKGREIKSPRSIKTASNIKHLNILSSVTINKQASEPIKLNISPGEEWHYLETINQQLQSCVEKISSLITEYSNRKTFINIDLVDKVSALQDEVEQVMYNQDVDLPVIYKAAAMTWPDKRDMLNDVFTKVKAGIIKKANPVSRRLIANPLKTTDWRGVSLKEPILIINGDTRILHIIDTINSGYDYYSAADTACEHLHVAKSGVLKEILDLSDTEKINKYLDGHYIARLSKYIDKFKKHENDFYVEDTVEERRPYVRRKLHKKATGGDGGNVPGATPKTDAQNQSGFFEKAVDAFVNKKMPTVQGTVGDNTVNFDPNKLVGNIEKFLGKRQQWQNIVGAAKRTTGNLRAGFDAAHREVAETPGTNIGGVTGAI